jgi:hypothetical protein
MSGDCPIDLEKLRLPSDIAPDRVPVRVVRPKHKREQHFIRVPWVWHEKLVTARCLATYPLAVYILYQHWKRKGEPFTLPNFAVPGITRWRKWKALAELETLGLITVERRRRKSPMVRVR